MKKSSGVRRAVSFGGVMRPIKYRVEGSSRKEFFDDGLPTARVPFHEHTMSSTSNTDRYGEGFYEDRKNKTDNFYSSQPATESGWTGPHDYAIIPKQQRGSVSQSRNGDRERKNRKDYQDVWVGSKDNASSNTKDYQDVRGNTKDTKSQEARNDYQDVWAKCPTSSNRKDYEDVWGKQSGKRRESRDVVPSVPNRKYEEVKPQAPTATSQPDPSSDQIAQSEDCPPKIAPMSGYLQKNTGKAVVRPIAFKPVVPTKSAAYTTSPQTEMRPYDKQYDDGYSSQESRSCSHNGTIVSRESYGLYDQSHSYETSPPTKEQNDVLYHKTPSPSDSGVGEFEQILREKENELITLRESMEANEKVILQVNEDNRKNWESQMKELAAEYHRRLRIQGDRAQKTEQELRSLITTLQKDNLQMAAERDNSLGERNKLQDQIRQLRLRNEDISNKLTEMTCNNEMSKHDAKESSVTIRSLQEQLAQLKADNMNYRNELSDQSKLNHKLERERMDTAPVSGNTEIHLLKQRLAEQESKMAIDREQFEKERRQWEDEKKRVLQYQKQLQANYIAMCRRNSELEDSQSKKLSSAGGNRSQNNSFDNNNPSAVKVDRNMFKMQLDSKAESLC